jgi:hypothetical protein
MKTTRINRHLAMFIATIMALTLWAGFPLQASATSVDTTIDLADDSVTLGTNWSLSNDVYTITNGANITIMGETTTKRIEIASNATVTVTLDDASIVYTEAKEYSPFKLNSGANAKVILSGTNTLQSNKNDFPALSVESSRTLTITSINGTGSTDGTLTATGKTNAAGIGSTYQVSGGNIIINGGTIIAKGGSYSPGIGGANGGNAGNITINGGNVTATGGYWGAGIGGGASGEGGNVEINNGIVVANAGSGASGIGGGIYRPGNITINGGNVTATGNTGAGIGGGAAGHGGKVIISAGIVNAVSTDEGAAIGGGGGGNISAGTIEISGGTVTAVAGKGVAIGSNYGIGTVTISDTTIFIKGNINMTPAITDSIILATGTIKDVSTNEVDGIFTEFDLTIGESDGYKTVTINEDLPIASGKTLIIDNGIEIIVPESVTLTVADGATIDVFGKLTIQSEGILVITDNGDLKNTGTISGGGSIVNNGTIYNYNAGTITITPSGDAVITVTAPVISTESLNSGTFNTAYNQSLSASNGNAPEMTWSLASGSLPAGLSLNPNTGEISGTPTAAVTSDFTVRATNFAGNDTEALSLTIDKAAGAAVSASPTRYSRTHNTVTLNPVLISGANPDNQTVEYGISESSDAPFTGWQNGTKFSGLSSNTPYYFFARAKENDNYAAGAPSSGTSITTQIAVGNVFHDKTVTYSPSGINLIGTDGLFEFGTGAGTPTYTKENGSTGTGSINDDGVLTVTSCGTFIVSLTTAEDEEYAAGEKVTATLTVNKADQTGIMIKEEQNDLTGNSNVPKSRDDLSFDLTASGGESGGVYTWSSSNADVATVTETGETATVTIGAAGDTEITVKRAGNANYNDGSASFTLAVSEATSAVTLTAAPAQLTYGNTTTLTAAVAKVGNIYPTGTVTFYQGEGTDTPLESNVTLTDVGGVMTAQAQVELDAGTYGVGGIAIHAEYAGDLNYKSGSGILAVPYEVGKAGQNAVTVDYGQDKNITSLAKTYGDEDFELTAAGGSGTGTYAWTSSNEDVATVTDTGGTTTVTIQGFGTANITLSRNGDDNHNATTGGENATVVLTVNPKNMSGAVIMIENATWTYDGGDKEPGVVSVTLDENPLTETADYTVSYDDNIHAGDAASVIITGTGNYTGEASTTFTIGPKPITFAGTVTATKTYDGNPNFNATHMAITGAESFGASDIVDSDKVELDKAGATGTLANANVQTGATLELQEDFSLTGQDAKNYILSAQPSVTASITRAAGSFGSPPAINVAYTSGLTLADLNGQLPGGYAWLAPGTALNAGDGQTFAAVYTHPSGNYTPASGNITVNVTKDTDGDGGSVIVPPGSQVEEEGENIKVTLPDGGGSVVVPPGSTVTSGENEGEIEVTLPSDGGTVIVPPGATVMPGENEGEIEVTLPGDGGSVIVPPGSTVTPGENEGEIEVTLPGDGGTVIVPPGATVDADGNVTAPPDNPPATTGEWVYEDGAWKYLVGGVAQTGWLYDTGYKAWFYFAENGIMQTGWIYDQKDKAWYYLAGNGKMVAGKWLHDTDGNWYDLSGNGKMLTGKQSIGGKVYSFRGNGVWIG